MLSVSTSAKTDQGPVRPRNEDAVYTSTLPPLIAVADGMGGHAGGTVASSECIRKIDDLLKDKYSLLEMTSKTNLHVFDLSLERPLLRGMGTTFSAVLFEDGKAKIMHVGDSRAYLLRKGFIYQLTADHSFVAELHPEQKATVSKSIITRCLGYCDTEEFDFYELALEKFDIFFVSSDGLHGFVKDENLCHEVATYGLESHDKLIFLAYQGRGYDNISVALARIDEL